MGVAERKWSTVKGTIDPAAFQNTGPDARANRRAAKKMLRRPRRSLSLYRGAEVALVLAFVVFGIELLTKQAFVSGALITVLLIAAATLFLTGRLLKSV
jgi:hypothetical protein